MAPMWKKLIVKDDSGSYAVFFLLLNSMHNQLHQDVWIHTLLRGKEFHVISNWTCLFLNMTSEMSQMEWNASSACPEVPVESCLFDDPILF